MPTFVMSLTDEIFSFVPDDGSKTIYVNATALRKFCDEWLPYKIQPVEISQSTYEQIKAQNGIEPERIARLAERPDIVAEPLLFIACHDGTHILVDGNHRLVVRYERGDRDFMAWVVPEFIWREFAIQF